MRKPFDSEAVSQFHVHLLTIPETDYKAVSRTAIPVKEQEKEKRPGKSRYFLVDKNQTRMIRHCRG